MKKEIYIGLVAFLAIALLGCKKDDPTPFVGPLMPANFPAPVYDMVANPATEAGVALGKKLFYDNLLSRDNTISCATCHISYSAFSNPGHQTSHGIDNLFGRRNAPAIQNVFWKTGFFWDGGVPNLDLVPLNAIQSPVEMDEDPARVLEKLRRHSEYPALFKKAYGSAEITTAGFLQALSQFMGMLVSANSRYDHYVRNEPGGDLTQEELDGLEIFKQKCASCHSGELFSDQQYRNNGLLDDFSFDRGRNEVSQLPEDIGKFRVPSLRNIAATAPYMHHGKFSTLEKVLDHYASGVLDSPTLDPLLRQSDGSLGIPLSSPEKAKLLAFLKTLTDEAFLRDTRFSE